MKLILEYYLIALGLREPKNRYLRIISRYVYTPAVLIFLLIPAIFSGLDFIKTLEKVQLSYTFFSLVVPVQYFLGAKYYRSNHLHNTVADCERENLEYIPTHIGIVGIGLVLSACLLTVNLALMGSGQYPRHFALIPDVNMEAYTVIYWIYSWLTLSINTTVFGSVFAKHIHDLKKLERFMSNDLIWKMERFSFNDTSRWIVNTRYAINGSIDRLESFYTTATIIGAIALGPVLEFKTIDPYIIYYVVVYILLQISFMTFIYLLSKIRGDLYKIIKSPMVMSRYLARMKDLDSSDIFRVIGSNDDDQINLVKLASHVGGAHKLKAQHQRNIESNEIPCDHELDLNEIVEQELADLRMGYKTMAGVDWIILQRILSERWADFSLMGIPFGGTDVIFKGVGLTSLMIMASTYLNRLIFADL